MMNQWICDIYGYPISDKAQRSCVSWFLLTSRWHENHRPDQNNRMWPGQESACLFHSLEHHVHVPSGLFGKKCLSKMNLQTINNSIARLPTLIEFDHCYRPSNGRTLLLRVSLVLLIAILVWYIYFILPCLFGFLKFKLWQLGRTHSVGVNKSH